MINDRKHSYKDRRRSGKDRRVMRFGQRGPKWWLDFCNFLTRDPRVFTAYLMLSTALALVGLLSLSGIIPNLINSTFFPK